MQQQSICVVFVCACLLSTSALAGVFSVTPVRIYINPKDRAIAITLKNEGDEPVTLQADINKWSQSFSGEDKLEPTEDLILAPPIINLAPLSRQVVRLAVVGSRDPTRQLTYRLVVKEVPEIRAAQKDTTLQLPVALALSMPVFVAPQSGQANYVVSCALKNWQNIDCSNTGQAYAQIREASIEQNGQALARFQGGTYILPGAHQLIALKADPKTSAPFKGEAQLIISMDDGKRQTTTVSLSP